MAMPRPAPVQAPRTVPLPVARMSVSGIISNKEKD